MASPSRPSDMTPTGNALVAFSLIAAFAGLIWVIAGPLDWFAGWKINKASAILLLMVGLPVAGLLVLFAALAVFLAGSAILELAGVQISRAVREESSAAREPATPPALAHGTSTHGLTAEEATRARDLGVYYLYAYGTDSHGWPEADLDIVAVCLNEQELGKERDSRPLQPGWDGFKQAGPYSLLKILADGGVTAAQAREFLRRAAAGEPHRILEPPLTEEERAAAAGIDVWYVWYEDQFGGGGQRDSFPVAVALTEADAAAAARARGKPLVAGFDGYAVRGPYGLERERSASLVRELLALKAAGGSGVVNIDSSSW